MLYTDSAVAGEAAGIAMGLLCTGSQDESSKKRIEEMLAYAHDTAHEKIIRGLALGLAMIAYGREEGADAIVDALTLDQVRSLPLSRHVTGLLLAGLCVEEIELFSAVRLAMISRRYRCHRVRAHPRPVRTDS